MGYSVTINGNFDIKRQFVTDDTVNSIMERILASDCFDEVTDEGPFLGVRAYDLNYHEDELFELYAYLEPYLLGAYITFEGEDGCLWCHTFSEGKWQEGCGVIRYEDFTDFSVRKFARKVNQEEIQDEE